MKKLLSVIMLCLAVCWSVSAAETSLKGEMRTRMTWATDTDELGLEGADSFSKIDSRVRLYMNSAYSDDLAFTLGLEIGDFDWGRDGHNHDEKIVEVKHAYFDFHPVSMDYMTVRMGLQGYKDGFHQAVFDEDVTAIMLMADFGSFSTKGGVMVYSDDDAKGSTHESRTIGLMDIEKESGNTVLKGILLYDARRSEYNTMYIGAGADVKMDPLDLGAQLIYMSASSGNDALDDLSGMFAYAYGKYNSGKLGLKLNFGYAPADEDSMYYGIEEYADVYGLEYAYSGPVYDGDKILGTYGGETGQMVVSINASYDWLYANLGMINATNDNMDEKSIGTEIDLGVKTELAENLSFNAVYAMFMPGDAFGEDDETAHELSTQIKFKF